MKIVNAKPLASFCVRSIFDNGEAGVVDLSGLVGRGVFKAWEHPGVFEQARVTDQGALEWPGELDLCPDALHMQMTGKKPEEVFPALKNRLSHA